MTAPTRPLLVATLNVAGAFWRKERTLAVWQRRERIDVLCLTETGRAAEEHLRLPGTFAAECLRNPNRAGCAIMVAPWVGVAKLEYAAPNGALLLVSLPLGGRRMMVAAAYAPHSPVRRPALAESFWQGLGQRLAAVEVPLVLGIDANYTTFPHDKKSETDWRDAERAVPAIATCWADSGLVDAFAIEDPSRTMPTWFQCHAEEDLVRDPHLVPWPRLVQDGACRAHSRIDKVYVSPALAAGATVTVDDCAPITTDHRPVRCRLPVYGLWRQAAAHRAVLPERLKMNAASPQQWRDYCRQASEELREWVAASRAKTRGITGTGPWSWRCATAAG